MVTVGLDIGTTSIKAVAVDDEGRVLARSRVPHQLLVPAPDLMEHDAERAWRRGPRQALAQLGDVGAEGVGVAAMVPSLTAVNSKGRPTTPGLLYGDKRGTTGAGPGSPERPRQPGEDPGAAGAGEMVGFLRWQAMQAPQARGYWPATAVALHALGGTPAVDQVVGFTSVPLFGAEGWDKQLCADCGVAPEQLPVLEPPGTPAGRLEGSGPVLTAGSVDVWCEQLVAGADRLGDVHVICGTTLIVWAVTNDGSPRPGLWTVPHVKPGQFLVGGASNAGGLFMDWAGRLGGKARTAERVDPHNIPVWTPYPRGERTPYHDPDRLAGLHDLNLTHGPAALKRAGWEAAGFVARHHFELAGVEPTRIVATGGGTRVEGWMQALADCTGAPVHVASDPEGAARGAAFLARMATGNESDPHDAARWARTGRTVDPDPVWQEAAAERYGRFLELSGPP